ncbi:MAG: DEAD/DEAH box helicase [Cytophagales bacterium]|nr:MAG: DEAD/DEAH box helicase [Cytophagales bacterium]TAF62377.1 MAG: DEAD/DEAH box helicase [Cytophagales bacterium]
MNVSPQQPFIIIYSLFQHEFLGVLFQPFIIQLDANNRLTLTYQHVSSSNVQDFAHRLDKRDLDLVSLMDEIRQEHVVKAFSTKKISVAEFFLKNFDAKKGDKTIAKLVLDYVEKRKAQIITLLKNRLIFEMGNDGMPTRKRLYIEDEPASILFHFFKNPDNTHYFPTIKHQGKRLDFRERKDTAVVCNEPAYLLVNDRLFHFKQAIDGKKLKPFLTKKFIKIPQNVEKTYYHKFVAPLISDFEVHAEGFGIKEEAHNLRAKLCFSELTTGLLFENTANEESLSTNAIFYLKLELSYGAYEVRIVDKHPFCVKVDDSGDKINFIKIKRRLDEEKLLLDCFYERSLDLRKGYNELERGQFFSWLNVHSAFLEEQNIEVIQTDIASKRYFVGESKMNLVIHEKQDWFDVAAKVFFGNYEIPFSQIRKYITKGQHEFLLPSGEVAVIPSEWFAQYHDLLYFSVEHIEENSLQLSKHHLVLAIKLRESQLAKVQLSRGLEQLLGFESIEDQELPKSFVGTLRPYQKGGYDWLKFLQKYHFGGCLADDMGLGKTVQTLALLAGRMEEKRPSLLVMPTSLLYNWQMEIRRFVPEMRVYVHRGSDRATSTLAFEMANVVITSYGTLRADAELMKQCRFDYVVLDEAQNIKNPTSQIAKAVFDLKASHHLLITGTPIENSTSDLWSLMNFANPGLLDSFAHFKSNFLVPIEKKSNQERLDQLRAMVKPFILRRLKKQVATDLPAKLEHVRYVQMSENQKKVYEEAKSAYRNSILEHIEEHGMAKSQIFILQGISQLRQLANHPRMIDPNYVHDSGKLDDIMLSITSALDGNHKILIFSSFVKHLKLVQHELEALGLPYSYLDGQTQGRAEAIEAFQNNADLKVFLLSLKAGGVGLNLTAADYVFLLDPWWNPAAEMQAIDRAHRIGQQNPVFIYRFISQETIEEKILELQKSKKILSDELILSEEGFIKQLNKTDIEKLLE